LCQPRMPDHSTDESFLQRALDLARQGIGFVSPNPHVGAVIVDAAGKIVGLGTYTYDGLKHAEVLALEQAGEKARGGALYINLEPCSHQGRTPPCADAVIAAGIRRVVASMADPNPMVSGRGFEKLRSAGVHVEVGLLQDQARRLNESFTRYIRHRAPLVTFKAAMTLDGKIAPPPFADEAGRAAKAAASGGFKGNWITGERARAHVQQLRHEHDAILVGIGTVLADDPLLTDRSGRTRRRPLLRVILDSRLRLPMESRLVQSAAKGDVLVFCTSPDPQIKSQLEARQVRVEMIPAAIDGRPDICAVLRRLGQLEIASLMIEGGATVNGAVLSANVIDKVFFYYAPTIFASEDSIPLAAGAGFHNMSETAHLKSTQLHHFGEDFAVEGYVRDPYQE
jgi:diaminohydroxyphosphoribosylaminopyrimidine deaminase/5-amino-6-(5-phosphoribosylamino)uracil reductase